MSTLGAVLLAFLCYFTGFWTGKVFTEVLISYACYVGEPITIRDVTLTCNSMRKETINGKEKQRNK